MTDLQVEIRTDERLGVLRSTLSRPDREEANRLAAAWSASENKYRERRRDQNRRAWSEYHLTQAEALERTAAELAAEHRAKAEALQSEEAAS